MILGDYSFRIVPFFFTNNNFCFVNEFILNNFDFLCTTMFTRKMDSFEENWDKEYFYFAGSNHDDFEDDFYSEFEEDDFEEEQIFDDEDLLNLEEIDEVDFFQKESGESEDIEDLPPEDLFSEAGFEEFIDDEDIDEEFDDDLDFDR